MSKKSVVVTVDWREDTDLIDVVEEHDEVEDFHLGELDVGDLKIDDPDGDGSVVFERKTVSDFAGSMTDSDDHLRDQVERLEKATDASARVLIEGNMSDFDSLTHTRVKPQSLRGFTASLEERNGARVMFCSNRDNLVDYAIRSARKQFEERSNTLRVQTTVKKSEPVTKRMYGCIEGVGPEMAERLYNVYPSLSEAIDAETSDLMKIEGIGEKLALEIQDSLLGFN